MQTGLSTLAQTAEKFEASEQLVKQQETPSTTAVNESGHLEVPSTNGVEQPAAEAPAPEENVSSFSLSINGEQPKEPETTTTQTQPAFNFDDELKKLPRSEVLKKLGVNDFALEIDEYLAKGGKAIDYLNAKSIDYNSFTDADIVKEDLKKQYPTFTPQQIDLMFNRKYSVSDVAEDEEKEFVGLQLKADAYNSRQLKISE